MQLRAGAPGLAGNRGRAVRGRLLPLHAARVFVLHQRAGSRTAAPVLERSAVLITSAFFAAENLGPAAARMHMAQLRASSFGL